VASAGSPLSWRLARAQRGEPPQRRSDPFDKLRANLGMGGVCGKMVVIGFASSRWRAPRNDNPFVIARRAAPWRSRYRRKRRRYWRGCFAEFAL